MGMVDILVNMLTSMLVGQLINEMVNIRFTYRSNTHKTVLRPVNEAVKKEVVNNKRRRREIPALQANPPPTRQWSKSPFPAKAGAGY